ncbi:MAG: hypothetical protein EHM36_06540, partial [Deltaproteobacteria bacterium]
EISQNERVIRAYLGESL